MKLVVHVAFLALVPLMAGDGVLMPCPDCGHAVSNVAETYQPDQVSVVVQVEIEKDAATTQENAAATQEWDANVEERKKECHTQKKWRG